MTTKKQTDKKESCVLNTATKLTDELFHYSPLELEQTLINNCDAKNILLLCPDYDVTKLKTEKDVKITVFCNPQNFSFLDDQRIEVNYGNDLIQYLHLLVNEKKYTTKFGCIIMTRVLEHLDLNSCVQFFWLASNLLECNPVSKLYITYPDFDKITSVLKSNSPFSAEYTNHIFELFDCPGDPLSSHKIYLNSDIFSKIVQSESYFTIESEVKGVAISNNRYVYNVATLHK